MEELVPLHVHSALQGLTLQVWEQHHVPRALLARCLPLKVPPRVWHAFQANMRRPHPRVFPVLLAVMSPEPANLVAALLLQMVFLLQIVAHPKLQLAKQAILAVE
jgi:hypothetical protein